MPLLINIPDSAYSTTSVTLSGQQYTFDFSYNETDDKYRLSISQGDESVLREVKLQEGVSITLKYDLPSFDHGELSFLQIEEDEAPSGRNNTGIGKSYQLIYQTNEEIAALST